MPVAFPHYFAVHSVFVFFFSPRTFFRLPRVPACRLNRGPTAYKDTEENVRTCRWLGGEADGSSGRFTSPPKRSQSRDRIYEKSYEILPRSLNRGSTCESAHGGGYSKCFKSCPPCSSTVSFLFFGNPAAPKVKASNTRGDGTGRRDSQLTPDQWACCTCGRSH